MPFENKNIMDQKKSFIQDYLSGAYYFNSLCESYKISRKTGYKWVNRYEEFGEEGLSDRTSRPRFLANSISEGLAERIEELRRPRPRAVLGARKIRVELLKEYAAEDIPSATTIHNVLRRRGLIVRKKQRRRVYSVNTKNNPKRCNEIWTIDYKGHFKMGNGRRCHPLTICDSKARYLLRVKGQYRETQKNVRAVLKEVFREYGQPEYLLSDNGSCFASIQSPCGYGSLSYWLIDLGIIPIFSDPGCPGQNGRHERMHREMKAFCCHPPAKDLRSQNRLLNEFGKFYNYERSHENLNDAYPGDLYEPSNRPYTEQVRPAEYDVDLSVRNVLSGGAVRWGHDEWVMISRGLAGKRVGFKQVNERVYEVYYRSICLGFFELGDQVESGRYYRLMSDRDLPQRERDRNARKRRRE